MKPTDIVCPDGQINSASHFLNFVDSRCTPYTSFQLFLFVCGCLMWVVAYGIIIRNAFRFRYVDMAAFAVFSNFGWETVWSFFFHTDMGWLPASIYKAWFFPDIFIVWLTFRYGWKQFVGVDIRPYFGRVGVASIVVFTLLYYFYTQRGLDEPIGANSAYMCQLFLSWTCLMVMIGYPDARVFSFWVAWLKGYGTGMNTVFMYLHYPENHFLHTLGTTAFVIDNLYIWILWKRKRAHGLPLWTSAPAGESLPA
jgi:hypothetical protein